MLFHQKTLVWFFPSKTGLHPTPPPHRPLASLRPHIESFPYQHTTCMVPLFGHHSIRNSFRMLLQSFVLLSHIGLLVERLEGLMHIPLTLSTFLSLSLLHQPLSPLGNVRYWLIIHLHPPIANNLALNVSNKVVPYSFNTFGFLHPSFIVLCSTYLISFWFL